MTVHFKQTMRNRKLALLELDVHFDVETNYASKCMALNMNLIYTSIETTQSLDKYSSAMNRWFQYIIGLRYSSITLIYKFVWVIYFVTFNVRILKFVKNVLFQVYNLS